MTETKTILLIGRSGRGKSTLANVLSGTNNFKESSGSTSETRKIQFEQFTDEDSNYLVIDTPGIGDTKLKDDEVLDIIAEAVYLVRDGVNQVFFVIDGRFDQFEMATYNLLRTIIFDEHVTKCTTITRTRFNDFEELEKCKDDINLMVKEAKEKKIELEKDIVDKKKRKKELLFGKLFSKEKKDENKKLLEEVKKLKKELTTINLAEIIESCQEKVVHVDNPSIIIDAADDEDEEERKEREELMVLRKEIRSKSREILLKYLGENCQNIYNPPKLKELSTDIAEDYFQYMEKKKELEAELEKLKTSKSSSTDNQFSKVEDSKNKSENISKKNNEIESAVGKEEEKANDDQELATESSDIGIGERIIQLESERVRLKREIEEKEQIIRRKVLKHIFNNYKEISREIGGEILIGSIAGDYNWEDINQSFIDKKLIVRWLKHGFDYHEVQKWVIALGNSFNPKNDADFCAWLRDIKQLTVEKIKRLSHPYNIEQLRKEYHQQLEKEIDILDRRNRQLSISQEEIILEGSAQEWLNKNYPKEQRVNYIELTIIGKNLEGELKLEGFANLEILECANNKLTKLDISMCPKLKIIDCGNNQLSSLNFCNSKELIILGCWNNKLTNLDITNCPNLETIGCSNNSLVNLNLSNNLKLKSLDMADNNFPPQDLSFISHLVNLKNIAVGISDVKKNKNEKGNRFYGSLEPLKNMSKLEIYSIDNTKIDKNSAQKYLPETAKIFYCPTTQRLNLQVESTWGNVRSGLLIWSVKNTPATLLKLTNLLVEDYNLTRQKVKEEAEIYKAEENQIQVSPK